jgi:hypothetical protein
MHENNLYQVDNPDDPLFVGLVDLVKSQAGLPSTRNWEQKMPWKCRDLVYRSTRTWKKDGLLVTRNNLTKKRQLFQSLWDRAIEEAEAIERSSPSGEPRDRSPLVDPDFDQVDQIGWGQKDTHPQKVSIDCPTNMINR